MAHKDTNPSPAAPAESGSMQDAPVCDSACGPETHAEALAMARAGLPTEESTRELAELFKALGEPTRAKLLLALSAGELCVCDLAELAGATPSAISHQLRVLRAARLVTYRKDGKNVFYRLDDEHVRGLLTQGLAHVSHR